MKRLACLAALLTISGIVAIGPAVPPASAQPADPAASRAAEKQKKADDAAMRKKKKAEEAAARRQKRAEEAAMRKKKRADCTAEAKAQKIGMLKRAGFMRDCMKRM